MVNLCVAVSHICIQFYHSLWDCMNVAHPIQPGHWMRPTILLSNFPKQDRCCLSRAAGWGLQPLGQKAQKEIWLSNGAAAEMVDRTNKQKNECFLLSMYTAYRPCTEVGLPRGGCLTTASPEPSCCLGGVNPMLGAGMHWLPHCQRSPSEASIAEPSDGNMPHRYVVPLTLKDRQKAYFKT